MAKKKIMSTQSFAAPEEKNEPVPAVAPEESKQKQIPKEQKPKGKRKTIPIVVEPRLLILKGFVDVGGPGVRKYAFGGDEAPIEPPFPANYKAWVRAGWAKVIDVEVEGTEAE